jgi:predicted RNase H-like HicB family nuclease
MPTTTSASATGAASAEVRVGRPHPRRYTAAMQLTARIWPEEGGFVTDCVELSVVSQGDTEEEALSNLQEAVAGFLDCADPSEVRARMHAGMQVRTFDVAV